MKKILAGLLILMVFAMTSNLPGAFAGCGMCPTKGASGQSAVASAPAGGNTEVNGDTSAETANAEEDVEASEDAADSAA
ncbi:MAG TPA: hypothetical protein PKL97_01215 [Candidatus Omnitrophota bacterium]|nr:hypothetical protein [Candidatus Omnitrophota bacterium]